jgi:hypothetical protein
VYPESIIVLNFTVLHFSSVGPGGSPDENGETTLDALIMNGVQAAFPTEAIIHAAVYVAALWWI